MIAIFSDFCGRPETATSFPGNPRIGVPWGASQGIEEGKL